jgi:5'-3' exonuclease
MKYLLIDTSNMFFRARHQAHRAADTWTKLGFALHLTIMSANKVARDLGADHVVFALEGRSWRKDYYKPYKGNRTAARSAMTETEAEEDKLFWETYDELTKYLSTKTNCSVVRCATAEADDVIARWIALHPQDEHTIVSTDSDFVQMVAPNVRLYNGVNDHLFTVDGAFDGKGKKLAFTVESNSKIKVGKANADFVAPADYHKWALFLKCVRGDTGDNVFSAYPGAPVKGTKNRVGITEAFEDRGRRGYAWNNMMLQRWTDHEGVEHRVLDDYERNVALIDLTAQPQEVKDTVDAAIREQVSHRDVGMVGAHFLKFCGKFELTKLSDHADAVGRWMNQTYRGVLDDISKTSSGQTVLDSQAG